MFPSSCIHHNLSTNFIAKFVPYSSPCISYPIPVYKSQIKAAAKTKQKMAASFKEVKSVASDIMFVYRSVTTVARLFNETVPQPYKTASEDFLRHLFRYKTQLTIVVEEWADYDYNEIYDAVKIYLGTRNNPKAEQIKARKTSKQKSIGLNMEKGEELMDTFKDIKLKWKFVLIEPQGKSGVKRCFKVMFDSMHKETVVNEYLPFILSTAQELEEKDRDVKLYSWESIPRYLDDASGAWRGVNLDHPVTFDKLAMEPEFKKSIINDLDMFVRRKDYYKKVGKAWKRGYLLYGPPGTGKSSLIAAMANYLKFDVYDLELSSLRSNSLLRKVLLRTHNKSIIVIEDVDCSYQTLSRDDTDDNDDDSDDDDDDDDDDENKRGTQLKQKQFTLSGLLNVMDGLWSTCGNERIVVMTTNHKDKLDPALLRPGRMDMHIYMGYCTHEGFDVLAFNYLGTNDHRLFPDIKRLIKEVDITPAEIAEHLMRNEDTDLAFEGVLDLLKRKKNEERMKDDEREKPNEKKTKSEKAKKKKLAMTRKR